MNRSGIALDYLRDGREIMIPSPTRNAYPLTQSPGVSVGWLGPVITALAQGRTYALSLNPNNNIIVTTPNAPVSTMYSNSEELLTAIRIATAGAATKNIASGTYYNADLAINLTARCFGVRVTLGAPPQSWPFSRVTLTLGDGATALYSVSVNTNSLPLDCVLLGMQGAGGVGSIIGIAAPRVTLVAADSVLPYNPAATVAQTLAPVGVAVESLNMRDIGIPAF